MRSGRRRKEARINVFYKVTGHDVVKGHVIPAKSILNPRQNFLSSPPNIGTATMGRVKSKTPDPDRENAIQKAKRGYLNGTYPSIRSAASAYGIPNTTLQGRLRGA